MPQPAGLPVTDAAILAKITGGALVVAAADNLHRQQLADGLGSLQDVGARVLGVVLNRMAHKQNDAYTYDDYASAPATGAPSRRRHKPEKAQARFDIRAHSTAVREPPRPPLHVPSGSAQGGQG